MATRPDTLGAFPTAGHGWVAAFDGHAVEFLTPYKDGSMHYYTRLLAGCAIDGTVPYGYVPAP